MMTPPAASSAAGSLVAALVEPFAGPDQPGEAVLAGIVADRMTDPEIDLAAIVSAWITAPIDGRVSPNVAAGLASLRESGCPPMDAPGPESLAAALVVLPAVSRTWPNDRNVISGAYHLARLLDPDPANQWRAVGVSLATACFLRGQRDPVPEIAAAFRANDAPPELALAVSRVPVWGRPQGATPGDFEALLWCLHHERYGPRFPESLAGRGPIVHRLARAMHVARTREH